MFDFGKFNTFPWEAEISLQVWFPPMHTAKPLVNQFYDPRPISGNW